MNWFMCLYLNIKIQNCMWWYLRAQIQSHKATLSSCFMSVLCDCILRTYRQHKSVHIWAVCVWNKYNILTGRFADGHQLECKCPNTRADLEPLLDQSASVLSHLGLSSGTLDLWILKVTNGYVDKSINKSWIPKVSWLLMDIFCLYLFK